MGRRARCDREPGAARRLTAAFAAQPDPVLEERGLGLVGRIVTRLLGQSHAFVGRAMLESGRCYLRNGDPERAAAHVEAVLADFGFLLDEFADEDPFDEYVIALEYLLAAVELTIKVRGRRPNSMPSATGPSGYSPAPRRTELARRPTAKTASRLEVLSGLVVR
jgi:hypothetical protein